MSARENPLRRAPQGVSIYLNGWAFALVRSIRPYGAVLALLCGHARIGPITGRLPCGSAKTQPHCVGLGLLPSLRSIRPYGAVLALLTTQKSNSTGSC